MSDSSGINPTFVADFAGSYVVSLVVNDGTDDSVPDTVTIVALIDGKYGTVVSATGRIWLDRNLVAIQVATSSTDSAAYGDLYQWGRGADGHQLVTSSTTGTLSSTDEPGHGDFIYSRVSPYDWRGPQNDSLWQGVAGTNNPCPAGFRLPTEIELETEKTSWFSNDAAGAFGSPLKLVSAGYRRLSNGSLDGVGSYGAYWSSTVHGSKARYLVFTSSDAFTSSLERAPGLSVRCIQN